jgi:hypothetical protein
MYQYNNKRKMKNPITKKRAGRVAQGIGPEFITLVLQKIKK